ncbi:MAG: hypothetical protein J0I84_05235 [Terrimonas sp.]|nr:hypothetical protein [Terrimonas sp.]
MKLFFRNKTSRYLSLTVFLLFVGSVVIAQVDSAAHIPNYHISRSPSDTVNVRVIGQEIEKQPVGLSMMPWVTAIIVGIITVGVNIYISRSNRDTTLAVARAQLNGTLNATNRQQWINQTRDAISDFVTQCRLINIEFQEPVNDRENQKELNEKIALSRNKLKLLLAEHLDEHSMLLSAMEELAGMVDVHMLNNRSNIKDQYNNVDFMRKCETVIARGRMLLYYEWGKIQTMGL